VKKIFVVDDNSTNLLSAKEALSEQYNVMTISSALIMFDFLENIKPDLILLDIEMPEMNGFDALKKLKADERYSGIPVIFLTSHNDEAVESLGKKMGVVDFIPKPFCKSILLNRLKPHLESDSCI